MAETRALLGQQHRQQHQLAQAAQSLPSQSQIMLELSRLGMVPCSLFGVSGGAAARQCDDTCVYYVVSQRAS